MNGPHRAFTPHANTHTKACANTHTHTHTHAHAHLMAAAATRLGAQDVRNGRWKDISLG